MTISTEKHWENTSKAQESNTVSWYQETCSTTLDILKELKLDTDSAIIDVGSGTTLLIDSLIKIGLKNITALDISNTALSKAKKQLGKNADQINWINADITKWSPDQTYDVWHDRAVYHFLVNEPDRKAYINTLKNTLKLGGSLIISSFGLEGPEKCSGLPVRRHSPEMFDEELGPSFKRIQCTHEDHQTPTGSNQRFIFCRYERL
jgi:2-polyprenyl-3-methyl-5-hydroxy-6-metoxy-1,4-benzoquinol methylase